MRIDVYEAIEIYGYIGGKKALQELKSHFAKYQDWNRIKQILTTEILRRNRDYLELEKNFNELRAKMEQNQQLDAFLR
jgi:hypothetical protein